MKARGTIYGRNFRNRRNVESFADANLKRNSELRQ